MEKLTRIITTGIIAGLVLLSTNCLSTGNYMQDGINANNDWMKRNAPNPHRKGNYNYSPSKILRAYEESNLD